MMHEHRNAVRHIPPHERRSMAHVEFDVQDLELLKKAYRDEDTTAAAVDKIQDAPLEIQIIAAQLIYAVSMVNSMEDA